MKAAYEETGLKSYLRSFWVLSARTSNDTTERISFLDGIRGWAAVVVLLHHVIVGFLAFSVPAYNNDYLKFITDGHLAVLVFFVLSGYALSVSHLNQDRRNLPLSTTARYFRLAIPILVSCLIAYLLLKCGLFFNLEGNTGIWLGTLYNFDASFGNMLKFSLWDVFFSYKAGTSYNANLWTMPTELLGSFVIYGFLGIFRTATSTPWHIIIVLALILLIAQPLIGCFILGYLVAELNIKTKFNGKLEKLIEIISALIFASVIFISTYFRSDNESIICIMAASLVLSVSYSKYLKAFFSNRVSNFLGRISFPLYLIQIPVICSWSSYLFLKLPATGLDTLTSSNINLVSTIIICFLISVLLTPIEKFSLWFSKFISNLIISYEVHPLKIILKHHLGPIPNQEP